MQLNNQKGVICICAKTPFKINEKVLKLTINSECLNNKTIKCKMIVF